MKNKTNFPERFNQSSHIKIKPPHPKPKDDEWGKASEKANKLQEEINGVNMDPLTSLNEQYAHDLVMMGMLFKMADTHIRAKKEDEIKRLNEVLEKYDRADKNFEKNSVNYEELKANYKHLRIVQAKSKIEKDPKNLELLKKQEDQAKQKLETLSKKFEFCTENKENVLRFASLSAATKFLDTVEQSLKESSYRMDITDAEEINKIASSKISDLYSLAVETTNKTNSYNESMYNADITEKVEAIKDVAKTAVRAVPGLGA